MKTKKTMALMLVAALALSVLPGKLPMNRTRTHAREITVGNPQFIKDDSLEAGRRVVYDRVWFGTYPQSEVTGAALTKRITEAEYDKNNEAVVNGVKYCRMKYTDATAYHDKNIPSAADEPVSYYYNWKEGTDKQGYHYFRYDPICWKVLSVDGEKALLLAEKGLDTQPYNMTNEVVSWETSSIRSWLNGYEDSRVTKKSFLENAFTETEQKAIFKTNLASASGDGARVPTQEMAKDAAEDASNEEAGGDQVFLLSKADVLTEAYGYLYGAAKDDEERRCAPSTYAFAMGSYLYQGVSEETHRYDGNCWWWLLDAGSEQNRAAGIAKDGSISEYGRSVHYKNNVVRPAIYVDLNSLDVLTQEPQRSEEIEPDETKSPYPETTTGPAASIDPTTSTGPAVSTDPAASTDPDASNGPEVSENVASEYKKGDVNGDNQVTLLDARRVLRAALNLDVLNETEKKAADVNEDQAVNLTDAKLILRVALNLERF